MLGGSVKNVGRNCDLLYRVRSKNEEELRKQFIDETVQDI